MTTEKAIEILVGHGEPLYLAAKNAPAMVQWANDMQATNGWMSDKFLESMLESSPNERWCEARRIRREKGRNTKEEELSRLARLEHFRRKMLRAKRWYRMGLTPSRWVSPEVAKWLDGGKNG